MSLCWVPSWWRLHFAAAAEVPLPPRERERRLLSIEPPFCTCTNNNVSGISHSLSVNAKKHGAYFRKSGNPCGTLLGRNETSSAYPLMTLPVRRAVIRPSFASIADTLREEFANKGIRLYENICIDTYMKPYKTLKFLKTILKNDIPTMAFL